MIVRSAVKKFVTGSLVLVGLLAGCSSHKPDTTAQIPAPPAASEPYIAPAAPYIAPTAPVAPPVTDVVAEPLTPPTTHAVAKPTHTTHPAKVAVAAKGTKYVVKKGDTLSKIVQKKYGTVKAMKKVLAANPGLDANLIKVGQTIILP